MNRRNFLLAGVGVVAGSDGTVHALSESANSTACSAVPLVHPTKSSASAYFSSDYQLARKKFLDAATACGAETESHVLPGHVGPDGKPLAIDMAWVGPAEADTVVVSLSGTHGSEGFCGSAAQVDWLTNEAPRRVPTNVAALLIHAVNPYGFAFMLRGNENGVNINRNCIDFGQPLPRNALLARILESLPRRIGFDEDLVAQIDEIYAAARRRYGNWEVSDALGRGQYDTSWAPEFGGSQLQWSARKVFEILQRRCAKARHVAYIDWHTLVNIGDGEFVYLCFNQTGDPLYQRTATWWSQEAIDRAHVDAQWNAGTSSRRPSRTGLLMWGVQHALAPKTDVAGAVIEFCADPDSLLGSPSDNSRSWVYQRWLAEGAHHATPMGRYITAFLRESGSPTRRSFQEAALTSARTVYARTFDGAVRWSAENIPASVGKLVYHSDFT